MSFISTRGGACVTASQAILRGLAPDGGLYVPAVFPQMTLADIAALTKLDYRARALTILRGYLDDFNAQELADAIASAYEAAKFDDAAIAPTKKLDSNTHVLELFHGPTLAFKDVGGRFMARLLGYFIKKEGQKNVNVLVATSGDTGSAVANGFLGVPGIHVYVLYPKGKVSPIQECQFTTLGQNITALEVDGTFDDCQALVKSAFMDEELNRHMKLTSANSINVARFLPQSFYYFNAYAQLDKIGKADQLVVSVPSGNFGNITAGLFAHRMGLPIKRFVAANNRNDVFLEYLHTGVYTPRPSVPTIANAMDVGDPSNFARILDLYGKNGNPHAEISQLISGYRFTDEEIGATMKQVYNETGYVLDPHGACGYQALIDNKLAPNETGLFLETAHPAKFKGTVDKILDADIEIPAKLKAFMQGEKQSVGMEKDFETFKSYLLAQ